ncbi:hypothetical protein HD806DRAFT_490874 [Xylariaceae sp. AK1471]|nr:hypothetical protein HD806DRAFT_490874 [Xylariaceae sp. AK1471]
MNDQAMSPETGNNDSISATPAAVRYSQQGKDIGEAKNFSWEQAVPQNAFWDDLPFTIARNFLQAFTAEELTIIPINPDSAQSKDEKLHLLAKWLKKKVLQQEAEAAPASFDDVDYAAWQRVMLGLISIQHELGDLEGAEEMVRLVIDRRKDKSNLSLLHTLSGMLLNRGEYAEAERTARKVQPWLIERLGRDSPQALSSLRITILSLWKQGRSRHADAQGSLKELQDIVSGMGSGQYAVYQDEERDSIKTLMSRMD